MAASVTFRCIYATNMEGSVRQNSVIVTYRYNIILQVGQMLAYAYSLLAHVTADRKGVTAMEYGVIAAGIVIAVAAAAASLGSNVSALFTAIGGSL
jgi:pilus assembly protein Flp/PilA